MEKTIGAGHGGKPRELPAGGPCEWCGAPGTAIQLLRGSEGRAMFTAQFAYACSRHVHLIRGHRLVPATP